MAELKTQKNDQSVTAFLEAIPDERKRQDSKQIVELMQLASGAEPSMWGGNIIGFGAVHLKYASGRELDWFPVGFSPRKQNLTLYIMSGFDEYDALLSKLGKYKMGKACIYINKLADVNLSVLSDLIKASVNHHLKSSA